MTLWRQVFALLAAPLAPAVVWSLTAVVVGLLTSDTKTWGVAAFIAMWVLIVGYLHAFLLGLPALLAARSLRIITRGVVLVVATAVATLPYAIFTIYTEFGVSRVNHVPYLQSDGLEALLQATISVLWFSLSGLMAGYAWWYVATGNPSLGVKRVA